MHSENLFASEPRSNPLRVLSLSPWPSFWSMGGQAGAPSDFNIVSAFARNGHSVLHLAPGTAGDLKPEKHWPGVSIEYFSFTAPPNTRWLSRTRLLPLLNWLLLNHRVTRTALRVVKGQSFDVVFGHSSEVALATSMVAKVSGISSAVHFYGTFLHPLLGSKRRFLEPEYWAWKVPVTQRVIANDGTQGDVVAQWLGLEPKHYVFWMNGVDKETDAAFNPKEFRRHANLPPEAKVIFLACRLVAWKRVDRLVKAAPWLLKKRSDILFLIAGDGSQRSHLEQEVKDLGVENHFRFLGAVPRAEVRNYMRVADIVTSVNDLSNLGNPLLEALACGKAIVTLDVGATNSVICHGGNGMLAKPDDARSLAQVMDQVLNDAGLRQRLERNAKRFADEHLLSWDVRADMEVQFIVKMCQKNRLPFEGNCAR